MWHRLTHTKKGMANPQMHFQKMKLACVSIGRVM
jgi:hypothetical protein